MRRESESKSWVELQRCDFRETKQVREYRGSGWIAFKATHSELEVEELDNFLGITLTHAEAIDLAHWILDKCEVPTEAGGSANSPNSGS